MTKPKMAYFSQEDVLHLMISEEAEANSVELSPNITAELNGKGELIGIEIVNASAFVRDAILEGVQARVLNLVTAGDLAK
jgi:uncharacterized protein YuzE